MLHACLHNVLFSQLIVCKYCTASIGLQENCKPAKVLLLIVLLVHLWMGGLGCAVRLKQIAQGRRGLWCLHRANRSTEDAIALTPHLPCHREHTVWILFITAQHSMTLLIPRDHVSTMCNWNLDLLTGWPLVVKIGTSSTHSRHSGQCQYSLITHNCVSQHSPTLISLQMTPQPERRKKESDCFWLSAVAWSRHLFKGITGPLYEFWIHLTYVSLG